MRSFPSIKSTCSIGISSVALGLALVPAPTLRAEDRLALLIGCSYSSSVELEELPSTKPNLKLMETALETVGFEVSAVLNPSQAEFRESLDKFKHQLKAKPGATCLFYFSGFGLESRAENFLIPEQARLRNRLDLRNEAIKLETVIETFKFAKTDRSLVFLDVASEARLSTKAASGTGLATIKAQRSFIGIANRGKEVSDPQNGSAYTRFLAKNLTTPQISIHEMHTKVTEEMNKFTTQQFGRAMMPQSFSTLTEDFMFVPEPLRTALLIGAWDYSKAKYKKGAIADLPPVQKDLALMEVTLKSLKFEVTTVKNPTLSQAEDAVDAFGTNLAKRKGVGLFYFSGHGVEQGGKNYLLPSNANIATPGDVKDQAVNAQRVLNGMEAAQNPVNLVFLDCCRNEITKGFGDEKPLVFQGNGAFIGFSTRSGELSDAPQDGSPYTRFLAKHMKTPGLPLSMIHQLVSRDVQEFTEEHGDKRTPGCYSERTAPFYFIAPENP